MQSANHACKREGDSNAQRPTTRQQRSQETQATEEGLGSSFVFRRTIGAIDAGTRQEEIALNE
jgi:hypothetical protein